MNVYETAKSILTNKIPQDSHDIILEKVNDVLNESPQKCGKNYYAWRAPLNWKHKMGEIVNTLNLSEEYEIYKTLNSIVIKWKD
jgi:hypothetical protein